MQKLTFLRLLACALLCQAAVAHALDPLSFARYDQVRTTDLHIDLKADFTHKILSGYAELALKWSDPAARTLVLDTRELSISRVLVPGKNGGWNTAPFQLDPADPAQPDKGQALRIALTQQPDKVRIYYRTAPTASALQWLTPQQTMSGKLPFMFSQSEAINARSWVPTQDTPAVRFTYSARIEAPAGMRVVMSADNNPAATGAGGWKFSMPQPIPSYLLALAIGEIDVRQLGPRSAVYAEAPRADAAAYELADTEKMISAAESLYGPYRWGRYDMLVLPPSFPFGGMENPRLTFVTPTMIAGDRSLVSLIAHELAHSWSGNLVTNASWKSSWLNEGFTTYVTMRIDEALYGPDVALMHLQLEQEELIASFKDIAPARQALDTKGPDTDPSVYAGDDIIYAKGAWFLRTLEERSGRAVFDPFLRGWFDSHAFQSASTDDFVAYLRKNLLASHPDVMTDAELDEWLYGGGLPASARHAVSPRLTALDARRDAWLKGEVGTNGLNAKAWLAVEWMKFLNDIDGKATVAQLQELDQVDGLGKSGNDEIAFRFYLASVRAGNDVRQPLTTFLMSVGRTRFVAPLYAALLARPADQAWARDLYARAREHYHPLTQSTVDKMMAAPAQAAATH